MIEVHLANSNRFRKGSRRAEAAKGANAEDGCGERPIRQCEIIFALLSQFCGELSV